jgi:hypothetical protein
MGQALTHQMIAREAAAMLVEENTVVKNINTNRSVEFGEEVNGYKKGDTVKIMVPPVPVVFDGATFAGGGSAPAMNETYVSLQLDTQKHVAITFTAKEKKLDLTDFKERFLRPAMNSLSSGVNYDLLTKMTNQTTNQIGTWGAVPSTRQIYRDASALLNTHLAPSDMRSFHFSSAANSALAEANATLFHTAKELQAEFDENAVGGFAGFTFYEQQSLALRVNGAANTAYVVDGASQTGSSLVVKTGAGAGKKGQIFTIAGVYAVQPITGVSTGVLRQFILTADYAGGAGTMAIYPAITPTTSTVIGTVTASPADGAAITFFGTLSQSKLQNIGFHKNAFAAAFAPLPVLASCEGYTATVKGISVRVMTFGNGLTDTENTRIDVLYGEIAVRPDHSVLVTQ